MPGGGQHLEDFGPTVKFVDAVLGVLIKELIENRAGHRAVGGVPVLLGAPGRFGPLPPETDSLLKVVAIKGLCREANVAKIDVGPKGAVASFRGDNYANPLGLMQHVAKNSLIWKVRPDQKVVVKGEWDTPAQRLDAAEKILTVLAKLAKG